MNPSISQTILSKLTCYANVKAINKQIEQMNEKRITELQLKLDEIELSIHFDNGGMHQNAKDILLNKKNSLEAEIAVLKGE